MLQNSFTLKIFFNWLVRNLGPSGDKNREYQRVWREAHIYYLKVT
jgi:hypothetical protein